MVKRIGIEEVAFGRKSQTVGSRAMLIHNLSEAIPAYAPCVRQLLSVPLGSVQATRIQTSAYQDGAGHIHSAQLPEEGSREPSHFQVSLTRQTALSTRSLFASDGVGYEAGLERKVATSMVPLS
jgi:hypothetical protein